MQKEVLLSLISYNAYANRLVLDVAETLTLEERTRHVSPSHGSVAALLLHMLGCEPGFLRIYQGQPMPTLDILLPYLEQNGQPWN